MASFDDYRVKVRRQVKKREYYEALRVSLHQYSVRNEQNDESAHLWYHVYAIGVEFSVEVALVGLALALFLDVFQILLVDGEPIHTEHHGVHEQGKRIEDVMQLVQVWSRPYSR